METKVDQIITDIDYLQQKSKKTTWAEIDALNLKKRIIAANKTAWTEGHGLAAIQIGVPLMYGWIRYRNNNKEWQEIELLNPVIIKNSGAVVIGKEGCLSLPDQWFRTLRYEKTIYRNGDKIFTAQGWPAIIVQHEIDHIYGILCTARRYEDTKIGRNAPCPCKSGKKYKKCCLK